MNMEGVRGSRGYHSENQEARGRSRKGSKRMDMERGLIGKGARAKRRREMEREEDLVEKEEIEALHRRLFDSTLEDVFSGAGGEKDYEYLFRNVGHFETVSRRFTITRKKGGEIVKRTQVTLGTLDFNPGKKVTED